LYKELSGLNILLFVQREVIYGSGEKVARDP
jgi:hypothetical protein